MTTREYAYVITVSAYVEFHGQKTATYADTITWDERNGEHEAFLDRFEYAIDQLSTSPLDTHVLFWSFKPDALTEEPT